MSTETDIKNMDYSVEKPIQSINNESMRDIQKSKWHWFQVTAVCVIRFILSLTAGYLVWDCNTKENLIFKIFITFFAVSFTEIYIIYYAFYRVFMGNKCY